jgi:hypothetical protein
MCAGQSQGGPHPASTRRGSGPNRSSLSRGGRALYRRCSHHLHHIHHHRDRCRRRWPVCSFLSVPGAGRISAHGTVLSPAAWLPRPTGAEGVHPPRDCVASPGGNAVPIPASWSAIGVFRRIRRVAAQGRGDACAVRVRLRVRARRPGPLRPASAGLPGQGFISGPAQPNSHNRGSKRASSGVGAVEQRTVLDGWHCNGHFAKFNANPLGWRRPWPSFLRHWQGRVD